MNDILQTKNEYILQEADKLCSEYIAELESYSHDYPESVLQMVEMNKPELYAYVRDCDDKVQEYNRAMRILRAASSLKGATEPYETAITFAQFMKQVFTDEKKEARKKLYS